MVDRLDLSRTPPPPYPLLGRGGELFPRHRSIPAVCQWMLRVRNNCGDPSLAEKHGELRMT